MKKYIGIFGVFLILSLATIPLWVLSALPHTVFFNYEAVLLSSRGGEPLAFQSVLSKASKGHYEYRDGLSCKDGEQWRRVGVATSDGIRPHDSGEYVSGVWVWREENPIVMTRGQKCVLTSTITYDFFFIPYTQTIVTEFVIDE